MESGYIQNHRFKLQKKYRKLQSIDDFQIHHFYLGLFLKYIEETPLWADLLSSMQLNCPETERKVEVYTQIYDLPTFKSEEEMAYFSYLVMKSCATDNQGAEVTLATLAQLTDGDSNADKLAGFRSFFLAPLYEFLDEQIDEKRMVLNLLRRYKHKCEWFGQKELYDLWSSQTSTGEDVLAYHLYEYLYDQGVDFSIKPRSSVGDADLVENQTGDERLIADAKIFGPEKGRGKAYIAKGFNQIYQYTLSYNQPVGYLIIYKVEEKDLALALTGDDQSIPFVIHNNKTIFLIVIDIYPNPKTASVRGKLQSVEITSGDLISALEKVV